MAKNLGLYGLYALPAIAVTVVALSSLVVGAPRPYPAARLRGGPTEGAAVLSFRLEAFERLRELQVPLPRRAVSILADLGGGRSAAWRGETDAEGAAEVRLSFEGPPIGKSVHLAIRADGLEAPLAEGPVALSVAEWQRAAGRRGGYLVGQRSGPLEVNAAPGRGAFAVPFAEPLLIHVSHRGRPVSGATLNVVSQGATVALVNPSVTDESGLAVAQVTPREHAVAVTVTARQGTFTGALDFSLPVVPGAMRASIDGGKLLVESPIGRERAYVSFVDREHRLGGAIVDLSPDTRGGATGSAPLPVASDVTPLWAVVSSEMDTLSMARLGWPLRPSPAGAGEPLFTFDVPDRLLLDGAREAFYRDERRQRQARVFGGLFAVVTMLLALVLLGVRVRNKSSEFEAHLAETLDEPEPEARVARSGQASVWILLIAMLCVALGFLAVSLLSLFRL